MLPVCKRRRSINDGQLEDCQASGINRMQTGHAQTGYGGAQPGNILSQEPPVDNKQLKEHLRLWEESLTAREKKLSIGQADLRMEQEHLRLEQEHLMTEQEHLRIKQEHLRNRDAQEELKRWAAREGEQDEERRGYFKKQKREIKDMARRIPRQSENTLEEPIRHGRDNGFSGFGGGPSISQVKVKNSIRGQPTRLDTELILRQYNSRNIDCRTYRMAMDMIEAEEKLDEAAAIAATVAKSEGPRRNESPTRELIRKEYDSIDPRIMKNWQAEQLNLAAAKGGGDQRPIVKAGFNKPLPDQSGTFDPLNRLLAIPSPRQATQNMDFNNNIMDSIEHDSNEDLAKIKQEPTED
ncbi:uncharacterized protein BP5553_08316 [Venustampulla echinocandica]|uniref:Uncharacterized protein n=1 Tax=Venustampulla echinocandica TaxID=2656787 RepID=A0A370TGB5_9HELO|nr:uncharacterized protein BP5553_08316 [Venustampulla echinocandica]RDL33948.1 hypothetical protein BP5553_08316 [Venustampulla echinocandica]